MLWKSFGFTSCNWSAYGLDAHKHMEENLFQYINLTIIGTRWNHTKHLFFLSRYFRESHITTDTSFSLPCLVSCTFSILILWSKRLSLTVKLFNIHSIYFILFYFIHFYFYFHFHFHFLLVKKSKQFPNLLFVPAFLGFRFMSEKMSTVSNSSHDRHVIQRPGSFRLRVKSSSIATTSG